MTVKRCCQILLILSLISCATVGTVTEPQGLSALIPVSNSHSVAASAEPTLTLVSLNLAHGRRESFSQLFLKTRTIRNNLDAIADYLQTVDADLVALQEADGPSNWSGNFDHVSHLAEQAGYQQHVRAEHVNNWLGDYGTGILSRLPIVESYGLTFTPTPPTTNKGFTLASVEWRYHPDRQPVTIDVISLHLDFLREGNRKQQIQQLSAALRQRENPTILMGDFNSEAIATSFTTESFSRFRPVSSYRGHHQLPFSYGNKKLDWVLLSEELSFVDYQVDDVTLSDHRPVRVSIQYRGSPVLVNDSTNTL